VLCFNTLLLNYSNVQRTLSTGYINYFPQTGLLYVVNITLGIWGIISSLSGVWGAAPTMMEKGQAKTQQMYIRACNATIQINREANLHSWLYGRESTVPCKRLNAEWCQILYNTAVFTAVSTQTEHSRLKIYILWEQCTQVSMSIRTLTVITTIYKTLSSLKRQFDSLPIAQFTWWI